MFRTLRQRLVWSQVLPLLLILPLMGVLLVYSLEGQVLIPQLAKNLVGNARLLAEISNAEFELWGDPILFENLISRVQLSSDIQVMFLDGRGRILYSNNPSDPSQTETGVSPTGLSRALGGQEAALTNYSILNLSNVVVDVYEPVIDAGGRVIGIVRLSYRLGSLYDLFEQLRGQILWALGLGLILSIVLGTWLAFSISRPVREVTDAIYSLAAGQRSEPVQEYGPQELRSQARAVNFLVNELHSMEASRRQLLANVVHELGRPLGALRSAIHSLRQGAAADPALLEDLTHGMDEETLRLEYVLNELANLYDKARGPLELNRQPVEMADWLRGVLPPWKSAAEEKRLLWRDQLPASLPILSIDAMRMAEVVGNLLSNAVKYTPAGGTVTISAGADDASFWLTVADTGVGIQPDEREKIFQPFYRGETGRRIKQGMGLGLTIAREIVLAHGGELRVESEPGQGSAFTLTLPLGS